MKTRLTPPWTFALILFMSSGCVTSSKEGRRPADTNDWNVSSVSRFPEIKDDTGKLTEVIQKSIRKNSKELAVDDANSIAERLRHYFLFLGLTAKDFRKADRVSLTDILTDTGVKPNPDPLDPEEEEAEEDGDSTPSNLKAIKRIFASSTQFLFCADLRDWNCLEQAPRLSPSAEFRKETDSSLGAPIAAGPSLDMEVFFTRAWSGEPNAGVANRLSEKLQSDVGRSLSIAMYGINDIEGSMKPVYDQIKTHHQNPRINVRTVVDVSGLEKTPRPWLFDYVEPASKAPDLAGRWLFGSNTVSGKGMHALFQYDGTPDLIRETNGKIRSTIKAKTRIEWPTSHIMHNKFAILENEAGKKSVWTGTANFSATCMGTEKNSNMAVYIKNDVIGQAFLDQFNLMHEFDPSLNLKSRLVVGSFGEEPRPFKVGRFHRNKYPISHRLFTFNDGTKLRVHFAPTDDAEHRVILPMLLSAQAGDEIRISMFGGTGYEIVRALQFAQAKGANVRIVYDRQLGHGQTSWVRDAVLNLNHPNPYFGTLGKTKPGLLEVRFSAWEGKNHYKVGSLTRKQKDGRMVAEEIILGSQNWSSGGNDHNDENLISIQNLNQDIPSAVLFNQEFDQRLWVKSFAKRKD